MIRKEKNLELVIFETSKNTKIRKNTEIIFTGHLENHFPGITQPKKVFFWLQTT